MALPEAVVATTRRVKRPRGRPFSEIAAVRRLPRLTEISFLFSRTLTLVKRTPRGGLMRILKTRRLVHARAFVAAGRPIALLATAGELSDEPDPEVEAAEFWSEVGCVVGFWSSSSAQEAA